MAPKPIPAELRFWAKVNKSGPIPELRPDLGPCWVWTGCKNPNGYGTFHPTSKKAVGAHIWSYRTTVGPIASGMQLDHLCRNRACLNPTHLEPVTASVNVRRGESPAAYQARQTHCKRGHEFTPENTFLNKDNERICRICRKACAVASEARRQLKWKNTRHGRVLRDAWIASRDAEYDVEVSA